MAKGPQQPAQYGDDGEDKGWRGWLMRQFSGGDFFDTLFSALLWGAVLIGVYTLVIEPHKDDIASWLDRQHSGLGKSFLGVTADIDHTLGGLGGKFESMMARFLSAETVNQKALDMPEAEFRKAVQEQGVAEPLAALITQNRATLIPLIAKASGDPKNPMKVTEAFAPENQAKVMAALQKNNPALAKQMVALMLSANAAGEAGNAAAAPMDIAHNQATLDAVTPLLASDPTLRQQVLKPLLEQLRTQAHLTLDPEKVDALVMAAGIRDGKITPGFQKLITEMTDTATTGADKLQPLIALAMSPEMVAARPELLAVIQSAQVDGPATNAPLQQALSFFREEKNLTATTQLLQTVGSDKAQMLLNVLSSQDNGGNIDLHSSAFQTLQRAVLDNTTQGNQVFVDALQKFARTIDASSLGPKAAEATQAIARSPKGFFGLLGLVGGGAGAASPAPAANPAPSTPVPAADQAVATLPDISLAALIEKNDDTLEALRGYISAHAAEIHLAKDSQNAALQFIADGQGHLNTQNVNATLDFVEALHKNEKGDTNARNRDMRVAQEITQLVATGDLHKLTTDDITSFFADSNNVTALQQYLKGLDTHTLSDDQKRMLTVLQNDLVRDGGKHGIGKILADKESVEFLLNSEQQSGLGKWMFDARGFSEIAERFLPKVMQENARDVHALSWAMTPVPKAAPQR